MRPDLLVPVDVAGGTGLHVGARLDTVSTAPRAGNGDLERHFPLDTLGRLHELDLDLGADVGPTASAAPHGRREEVIAKEGREQVREIPEVGLGRPEPATSQSGVAVPVVELPSLGVGEHLVRLDDLLEPLLGIGSVGDVRMHLPSQAPKRLLQLAFVGIATDAEHLVVVALRRRHLLRQG